MFSTGVLTSLLPAGSGAYPVMALYSTIGAERNLLDETEEHARMIRIEHPVITNGELEALRQVDQPGFGSVTLSCLYKVAEKVVKK